MRDHGIRYVQVARTGHLEEDSVEVLDDLTGLLLVLLKYTSFDLLDLFGPAVDHVKAKEWLEGELSSPSL